MVWEIRRGVHHAKQLDHALHPVQAAEFALQGGQHRQTHLARRSLAFFEAQVFTHPACDIRRIAGVWPVAGDIGGVAQDDDRLVNATLGGRGRQLDAECFEVLFNDHDGGGKRVKAWLRVPDASTGCR